LRRTSAQAAAPAFEHPVALSTPRLLLYSIAWDHHVRCFSTSYFSGGAPLVLLERQILHFLNPVLLFAEYRRWKTIGPFLIQMMFRRTRPNLEDLLCFRWSPHRRRTSHPLVRPPGPPDFCTHPHSPHLNFNFTIKVLH
jgi:hypothetical protein